MTPIMALFRYEKYIEKIILMLLCLIKKKLAHTKLPNHWSNSIPINRSLKKIPTQQLWVVSLKSQTTSLMHFGRLSLNACSALLKKWQTFSGNWSLAWKSTSRRSLVLRSSPEWVAAHQFGSCLITWPCQYSQTLNNRKSFWKSAEIIVLYL